MTAIEWATTTWDPVGGCTDASEGCAHCWSRERTLPRLAGRMPEKYGGLVKLHPATERYRDEGGTRPDPGRDRQWTGKMAFWPQELAKPSSWRHPRRIFVCSQSDLFHEHRPLEHIAAVFGVMAAADQHTFLVLTKRPERARAFYTWLHDRASRTYGMDTYEQTIAVLLLDSVRRAGGRQGPISPAWPLPNIWLGVSAENQAAADERIPVLLSLPAAKRFVSYEPALSAVNLEKYLQAWAQCDDCGWSGPQWQARAESQGRHPDPLGVLVCPACSGVAIRERNITLDWVIAGCESGPGARPAPLHWVRSVRDQVLAARGGREQPRPGDPHLFIKQWDVCDLPGFWRGGRHRRGDSAESCGTCDGSGQTGNVRKGCPALDGRVWAEIPGVS